MPALKPRPPKRKNREKQETPKTGKEEKRKERGKAPAAFMRVEALQKENACGEASFLKF
jgi:hypothetical protein